MNVDSQSVALDSLSLGEGAEVVQIDLAPEESQRLMEMGLTRGTTVRVKRRAPLGYPVEIVTRGSHLSLRQEVVRAIRVRRSAPPPSSPG